MNKDEMNRAIAEACGWDPETETMPGGREIISKPLDYTTCLNACHEAKRQLLTTPELCDTFNRMLMEEKPSRPVEFETDKWTWGQSAEVEARALLRTLNLYQDTRES